ncbi:uncharacterized protein LOC133888625 [Phragmites australis]|uniref:uncharacterized protein LOC133888625 n=1 Tax=Phragmites australis TaxID=29695 RepID=UPI002D789B61|nr:uncharacterized protein LOC133888625 [Phragmites australis]
MASPPPPQEDAGAVCCMCGDQGLPNELFRCRSCRVRLQHRYCSDLYPRATAYRRCNWCLRELPAQQSGGAGLAAAASKPTATEKRKATTWEAMPTASDGERRQHEGCSRRPPAELGQPVKKRHKADERAPPPRLAAVKAGDTSDSEKLMRAGKTRVRVKVRRYRLLAEVISC